MIRWFANNSIAANFLMIGIVLAGLYTAFHKVPLEVQPSRQFNSIFIEMEYRGGTARDVEQSILIPIEEALQDLNGIEAINSRAGRGRGRVFVEVADGFNIRELLEEIKSRIDGISTFPSETEQPVVRIPDTSQWFEVLSVAVTGDLDETELRRVAQRVQDDLLTIDGISRVQLQGARDYEIAIEADQEKLMSYNIGFRDISDAIRRSSLDMPAGSIESTSGTLTVRTRGQAYTKAEFEKIPLRAANGSEVLLGEVAKVKDGFEEGRVIVKFNGEPAILIEVMRNGQESALDISKKVHEYVNSARTRFPEGVNLYVYSDESISIRGRLSTLTSSLMQGSILVFVLIGMFLRPQLAFWIVMGIPVSFAGGVILMPYFGITANVMSLFGYIIVVGIVVDDAIVTGENIYAKLKTGMDPLEAAVTGAEEVAVPVTFGVLTTIVAFLPLVFFDGQWGDFAKQIPPVVAPVLLFSLIESKLILPSHLKHLRTDDGSGNFFGRFQKKVANGLERFVERVYQPTLNYSVSHRYLMMAAFTAMGLLMAGFCQGGRLGFQTFPTVDRLQIGAYLDMPNDTTFEKTNAYVERIVAATEQLGKEFVDPSGESLVVNVLSISGARWIGSSFQKDEGSVMLEVLPPSYRTAPGPKNSVLAKRWTELIGPTPEARSLRIRGERSGGGGRDQPEEEPIEIELRGKGSEEKTEIAEKISDLFESFEGISDSYADAGRGQDELEITLKARALELGLNQQTLAQQIRQAFYGEEAQRVQRGRDDIRVMVRLPKLARESLHTLDNLKVRAPDGSEVPLATVADVRFVVAPADIERVDGSEVIKIFATPDDEEVDIIGIAEQAKPRIDELIQNDENTSYRFTGYIAENEESKRKTLVGAIGLAFALYALLAIPFKSMIQPIFVLIAVPFGIIGALLGHIFMGVTPSYLSIFGMLALAGVVVNDSLVMVDYVNRRVAEGATLLEAVLEAGGARFRPIMLTSVTTFVGLLPLLMDRSIQAQFLIPMAISLGFGIMFATVITLYLVPCTLIVAEDCGLSFARVKAWYFRPFRGAPKEQSAS